jgi:hypothetical protein
MLKVDDYCFRVYHPSNQHLDTGIMIYKVTHVLNESKFYAIPQDTTSPNFPKIKWEELRTTSHYTKCSSTTIEELKEEFPEVFI